jgi:uncharacterized protein (TIGR03437 family)
MRFQPNQGQVAVGLQVDSWTPTLGGPVIPFHVDISTWVQFPAPVQPANVTAYFSYLFTPYTQTDLTTSTAIFNSFSSADSGILTIDPSFDDDSPAHAVATIYDPTAPQQLFTTDSQGRDVSSQSDTLLVPSSLVARIVSPGLPVSGVSVTKDPSATWLNVSLNQTTTPVTATIKVDPNMPVGNYSTNLTFQSSSVLGTVVVRVNYSVVTGVPWFTRYSVKNAASYVNDVISPGELFYIEAHDFGPAVYTGPQLGADGRVATTLGNMQVLFDGQPVPLYYTAPGVITGFAPFSLDGKSITSIQVVSNGVPSPKVNVFVLDAVPGILTSDSSGGGPGVISNQDGSTNSPGNPESPGNTILLWGIGGGQTNPPGRDGAFSGIGAPVANLKLQVKVFIDGQSATDVSYAGAAPTLVEGVWVIKVRIPANSRRNANLPVLVQIGDKTTQPGVTVSVK